MQVARDPQSFWLVSEGSLVGVWALDPWSLCQPQMVNIRIMSQFSGKQVVWMYKYRKKTPGSSDVPQPKRCSRILPRIPFHPPPRDSQLVLVVKNPPARAGDMRDSGSIPGSGRSSVVGNGNLLQDTCLGNLMDRETWWAIVHGVAKSQTRLSTWSSRYAPI